jgi:signal transduction histidine kinase
LEKNADLDRTGRAKYLEVLLRSASALRRLVEDLFELSKLDAADAAPAKERFSLSELAQDVVVQMKPQAQGQKVELEMPRPAGLHFTSADVGMVERLLTNLIDNAIKNTPEGGRVTVQLQAVPGGNRLTVSDTGPGIAPEHLPFVFDRFYIADRSRSRSKSGSGLGLAICKRIAELHGGTIGVENREQGGAVFFFALPDGDDR